MLDGSGPIGSVCVAFGDGRLRDGGAEETCDAARVAAAAISHSTRGVAERDDSDNTSGTRAGNPSTADDATGWFLSPADLIAFIYLFFVLDRRWQHVTLARMAAGACHPPFYEPSPGRIPPPGSGLRRATKETTFTENLENLARQTEAFSLPSEKSASGFNYSTKTKKKKKQSENAYLWSCLFVDLVVLQGSRLEGAVSSPGQQESV